MREKFEIGDFVATNSPAPNYSWGRVCSVYSNDTPIWDDANLSSQTMYGPNPMRFINSDWYRLYLNEDLSAYFPGEALVKIEPRVLTNQGAYLTWQDQWTVSPRRSRSWY